MELVHVMDVKSINNLKSLDDIKSQNFMTIKKQICTSHVTNWNISGIIRYIHNDSIFRTLLHTYSLIGHSYNHY